jgi:hypothetical protein
MAKKAILLIPLTYNDGSQVSQEVLDSIFEAIFVLSGGYTAAGTVRGAYRMRDGSKQTDVLEQVWIAYEEGDQPALRELVGRFCSLLGQEMMYLEFADSLIEFIPPHEEASSHE